jgi:hypothetical protein
MKKSKSMKVTEYFLKYPNAIPKDVGAKFSMHMPQVYGIRKRVLSGSMLDKTESVVVEAGFAYDHTPSNKFVPSDKADDLQVGGDHYKNMGVQPWKAMESWMTPEQFAGFLRGNAIKYLARCDAKGGLDDIKKARHYIDKLVEVRSNDD